VSPTFPKDLKKQAKKGQSFAWQELAGIHMKVEELRLPCHRSALCEVFDQFAENGWYLFEFGRFIEKIIRAG